MWRLMRAAFSEFTDRFGSGWNRFWFTPADSLPLAVLRVCVGVVALAYVGSHTTDLIRWFGANGFMPADDVGRLMPGGFVMYRTGSPTELKRTPWNLLGRMPADHWRAAIGCI